MAVGGVVALLGPALQYGVPAAIEGIRLLTEFIEKMNNDPKMSQEDFDKEWLQMQTRLKASTERHEILRRQGK